jgi:hypothetical protein
MTQMKMKFLMNNYRLIAFLFLAGTGTVSAQDERMEPLVTNARLREAWLEQEDTGILRSSALVNDTLDLPFFDDFSGYQVWPAAERWSDSSAFVNPNFPINPPTVGVVTFDGLDLSGNPYDNSNVNANGLCDELTSLPLNLFSDANGLPYNTSDSIFLVFYFQRKGRGDNPETTDSLVVQFLDPATQVWNSVWKATGTASGDTVFNKVKISINDPAYRQMGFRFRFRNYGSKTGMLDLWHVDYISLNKFLPPDFDSIRDYAYVYEGASLLNNYSSIPWKHFIHLSSSQQQAQVKPAAALTLRNNNDQNPFPIKVAGNSYDQYGNMTNIVGGAGLNNIVVPYNSNLVPPAVLNTNSFFQDTTSGEYAKFTILYDIGTTSGSPVDDFSVNDTLRYEQEFSNYYAYDDGTAELGYGINGVGAALAYKFLVIKQDTLRAVKIYFAQLGTSVTNQIFRLAIWAGATSPVGSPVYEKFNLTPNYTDSINGFYTYLTDPVPLSPGNWFIGIIQNNAVLLNLGLDVNTPADPTRKFINTSGSWTNSQLPGMWMIRPVFSGTPIDVGMDETSLLSGFIVYPVPASGQLNLEVSHPFAKRTRLRVYDLAGRVLADDIPFSNQLDIRELRPGCYFLEIFDPVSGSRNSARFMVTGN